VVIAGGGYAGTTAAVTLAKQMRPDDGIEILLIEPDPCQQALSELDLVAVGPAKPEFCELWHPTVFKKLPVTVCYDRVDDVNPERGTVNIGPRGGPHEEISYWRLVIATGAIAFVPPVPGLAERAITMWSVEDAQELQRRLDARMRAAVKISDPAERRLLLSVVVVGGGATGVEMTGTLAHMLPQRLRSFGLDPAEYSVTLVEGRPDVLYDLSTSLRQRAKRRLAKLGVRLQLGSMVARVEGETLHLADGTELHAPVLVFCGGARPDPDAVSWDLQFDSSGRLLVDECCRAQGHDDIFAVGDVAAFRNPADSKVLPMLAQFAIREAAHVAEAICGEARGKPCGPYRPRMLGEFVSIGPTWGVGWALGVRMSGLPAIVMKRLTYVIYWLKVGGISLAWKRTREMLAMLR
jgi:NADH dehydrogenase